MDTERIIVISMAIAGLTVVAGLVVNMVMGAVARFRTSDQRVSASPVDERLARIEIAVEAIALEVERLGEFHRFNAKLESQRPPEPPAIARPITPH
jgi:hypothetical protein